MKVVRSLVFLALFFVAIYLMFISGMGDKPELPMTAELITLEEVRQHADLNAEYWTLHDGNAIGKLLANDVVIAFNFQKYPLIGRQTVVRFYEGGWLEGSPLKGNTLKNRTVAGADLGSGYFYTDGTWHMFTASGDLAFEGKSANVYMKTENGLRTIQESVVTDFSENVTLTPPPERDPLGDFRDLYPGDPAFHWHLDRFKKAWAEQDVNALTEFYTENAVRIIGSASEAIRGKEEIRDSFVQGFSGESPFQGSRLDTVVLGYRLLDDQHFCAHGAWVLLDDSGSLLARGQWGNLYRRCENEEVKLVMESSGAMIF